MPYGVAAQQRGHDQDSCRRHNPRPKRMILRWLIYRNSSKLIHYYGEYILDVHDVKDFREINQGVETVYTSRVGRFVIFVPFEDISLTLKCHY